MCHSINDMSEEQLMLGILGLVDMSMVANLVYMVVVGGYTMFVSKIDIADHADRPERRSAALSAAYGGLRSDTSYIGVAKRLSLA